MDLNRFDTLSRTTLSSDVAGALRKAIIDGVLEPGQRIIETTVAQHFGVSKAPVREAILELEKQGLVRNIPRKGAYVAEWTRRDLWEIYTLRQALEGMAARLAAQFITPEQREKIQQIVDQTRNLTDSDKEKAIELDLQFHSEICVAASHSRLQEMLMSNHLQTEVYIRNTSNLQEYWSEKLAKGHQIILDAICSGDPDKAEKVMRDHIGPRASLFSIER